MYWASGARLCSGILPDDQIVGADRLVPLLQLLGELPEQVGDARGVLRIGIILHHFAQHAAARFEVGLLLVLAAEFLWLLNSSK